MKFKSLFFVSFLVLFLTSCDKPKEQKPTNSLLKDYVKKPLSAAQESKLLSEDRESQIKDQLEDVE